MATKTNILIQDDGEEEILECAYDLIAAYRRIKNELELD